MLLGVSFFSASAGGTFCHDQGQICMVMLAYYIYVYMVILVYYINVFTNMHG